MRMTADIERIDEALRRTITNFLVRVYQKHYSQVIDAGLSGDPRRCVVLCERCNRESMNHYPMRLVTKAVDLLGFTTIEDNVLFRRYVVLAGQCSVCESVYFAKCEVKR